MTWILGVIKIIVLLGTLITIHELGHFLVARFFKIKILKFAIGFGPKVFTKTKGETEYTIRLIPFGGFVQMEGEESRSENEGAFNKKPIWQRILVVAAGALVNIIFALIIYFGVMSVQNSYQAAIIRELDSGDIAYIAGLRNGDEIIKVNNKRILEGYQVDEIISKAKNDEISFTLKRNGKVEEIYTTIETTDRGFIGVGFSGDREVTYIFPNSPADKAEMELKDVVVAINGVTVYTVDDVINMIKDKPGEEIYITVLRNYETVTLVINTESITRRYFDLKYEMIKPGFWKGFKYAIQETIYYFNANLEAYAEMFTGNTENVEVMGVVGIANEISKTSALEEFFYMMCAISLSLGIFNLFPIPALDGGRILLLIIEAIRRKPLSEKVEQNIILVGFLIIITFAIVVTVFDVGKLFAL